MLITLWIAVNSCGHFDLVSHIFAAYLAWQSNRSRIVGHARGFGHFKTISRVRLPTQQGAGFFLLMPHYFDPIVATQYGLTEAILIQNFQFWIEKNRANNKHGHDGRTWTYNSVRAFTELFPYLGKKQIYSALKRLETAGVILTGNYSTDSRDHTTWYAFADEGHWMPAVSQKEKTTNFQKGKSPLSQKGKSSITDNKPSDSKPNDLQARTPVGMYIVGIDGVCLAPEIPVIPEIPIIPVEDAPAEKSGKPEPRPATKEPDRDWQRWVDRFEVHVKKHNDGLGHHWTKIQFGPQGLKGIRMHLVKISTKLPDNSDDDCGYLAWCYVLDHWADLGDEWLGKQFDLTVVLKKITDILNRLKNAATTNRVTPAGGNGKVSTSQARNEALRNY